MYDIVYTRLIHRPAGEPEFKEVHNMKTTKYRAYDMYEECEVLGTYETLKEARAACKEREADTDGECFTHIRKITVEDMI